MKEAKLQPILYSMSSNLQSYRMASIYFAGEMCMRRSQGNEKVEYLLIPAIIVFPAAQTIKK